MLATRRCWCRVCSIRLGIETNTAESALLVHEREKHPSTANSSGFEKYVGDREAAGACQPAVGHRRMMEDLDIQGHRKDMHDPANTQQWTWMPGCVDWEFRLVLGSPSDEHRISRKGRR